MEVPRKLEVLIITLSDRAYKGEYADLSGPAVKKQISEWLTSEEWDNIIDVDLIPDESEVLKSLIIKSCVRYNIIFTTGGTGIGPRDITVDTVRPLLKLEIPGIMEYIRVKYGQEKPGALLSRGIAGIADKALIYTLPGSVRAVNEYMPEILRTLKHTIFMQYGMDTHSSHQ